MCSVLFKRNGFDHRYFYVCPFVTNEVFSLYFFFNIKLSYYLSYIMIFFNFLFFNSEILLFLTFMYFLVQLNIFLSRTPYCHCKSLTFQLDVILSPNWAIQEDPYVVPNKESFKIKLTATFMIISYCKETLFLMKHSQLQ